MRSTVRRHRSWVRVGLAPLALALAVSVAACGDDAPTSPPQSSASPSAPPAVASATPTPSPPSAPSTGPGRGSPYPSFAAFSACGLLTADIVTTFLGRAPASSPTEFEGGPNQQLCIWKTDGTPGNPNELDLGVFIKLNPADTGFGAIPATQSPQPVAGLGDTAEYAAAGGATGSGSHLIQASKGRVGISMTVHYGG